mgnify:CR=1 FL=1
MKTTQHKPAASAAPFATVERPRLSPEHLARLVPPSHCTQPAHSSALDLADRIINDRACSAWLYSALIGALRRDLVDAANDAELLLSVITARLEEVQTAAQGGGK